MIVKKPEVVAVLGEAPAELTDSEEILLDMILNASQKVKTRETREISRLPVGSRVLVQCCSIPAEPVSPNAAMKVETLTGFILGAYEEIPVEDARFDYNNPKVKKVNFWYSIQIKDQRYGAPFHNRILREVYPEDVSLLYHQNNVEPNTTEEDPSFHGNSETYMKEPGGLGCKGDNNKRDKALDITITCKKKQQATCHVKKRMGVSSSSSVVLLNETRNKEEASFYEESTSPQFVNRDNVQLGKRRLLYSFAKDEDAPSTQSEDPISLDTTPRDQVSTPPCNGGSEVQFFTTRLRESCYEFSV